MVTSLVYYALLFYFYFFIFLSALLIFSFVKIKCQGDKQKYIVGVNGETMWESKCESGRMRTSEEKKLRVKHLNEEQQLHGLEKSSQISLNSTVLLSHSWPWKNLMCPKSEKLCLQR